jgi:hypothetical protein
VTFGFLLNDVLDLASDVLVDNEFVVLITVLCLAAGGAVVHRRAPRLGTTIVALALVPLIALLALTVRNAQTAYRTDVSLHEMRSIHARATLPDVLDIPTWNRVGYQGAITLTNLNLRSGPGTNHAVITTLPIATSLALTDESVLDGDWLRVRHGPSLGWVHVDFVGFDSALGDAGLAFRSLRVTEGDRVHARPDATGTVVDRLEPGEFVRFNRFANGTDAPTGPYVEIITPRGVTGWFDARLVRLTTWPDRVRNGVAGALTATRDGTVGTSIAEVAVTLFVIWAASLLISATGRLVLDEEMNALQLLTAIQVFLLQYHDRMTSLDLVGWAFVGSALFVVGSLTGTANRYLLRRWLG